MAVDTVTEHDTDDELTDEERNWKALRTKAEDAEKRAADAEARARKAEVKAAGISEDHPLFNVAMRAESDDELAALAQAAKVPAEPDAPSTPDPELSDDERGMTDLRREAASGAEQSTADPDINVYQEAVGGFAEDVKGGHGSDSALAKAISKVNYAGMTTDVKYSGQVDAYAAQEKILEEAKVDRQWLGKKGY